MVANRSIKGETLALDALPVKDSRGAVLQVRRIGTPEANDTAREILTDARRRLYRLLADDEAEPTA